MRNKILFISVVLQILSVVVMIESLKITSEEKVDENKIATVNFYVQSNDEPIATYRTGKSDSYTIGNFHKVNDLSIFSDRGELGIYVDHYKCVRVEVEEKGQSREVNFYEANTDHLIACYYESEQGDYCTSSGLHQENSLSVLQGDVTITYLCVMVEVI